MTSNPSRRPRALGLFGDVLSSGVLVGLTALVNLASVFVFARALEPVAFGLFATCRRVVAFVAPFATLGGHLGVSRYLGYYAGESQRRSTVLQIGVWLTLAVAVVTAAIFLPLHRFGGGVGWVRDLAGSVWVGTAALAATTAAGLVVFSILRGLGHPRAANQHQLTVLAAVLVIGVVARDATVERLLLACAGSHVVINVAYVVWATHRHRETWLRPRWRALRASLREVLRYSTLRIADGPLQASLSLIGVAAAPAIGGLALSGYIHISQTVVRVTEIVVVPLGVIFLPLVARQVREGRTDALRVQAQLVYDSIFLIGACATAHGMAWGGPLLAAVFGPKYAGAVPFLLCSLPSILPFLVFAGFRSFVDGYSVRPVNSLHLLAASAFILVATHVAGAAFGGLGLSLAYTAGVTLLGALTVVFVRRHFGLRVANGASAWALVLAAVGGAGAWQVARRCDALGSAGVLAVCALSELVVVVATLWVAWRLGHPSVTFAVGRLRGRRGGTHATPITPIAPIPPAAPHVERAEVSRTPAAGHDPNSSRTRSVRSTANSAADS